MTELNFHAKACLPTFGIHTNCYIDKGDITLIFTLQENKSHVMTITNADVPLAVHISQGVFLNLYHRTVGTLKPD